MKNIIIVIFVLVCFSCKENKEFEKKIYEPSRSDEVLLIFKERSYKRDTLFFKTGPYSINNNKPIYYTDNKTFDNIYIEPKNREKPDTIRIKTNLPISLNHKYHYYYDSSYLFKPGDTVVFNYDNDAPKVSILNRSGSNYGYNFEMIYNLAHDVYKNNWEFFYENNGKHRTTEESGKYGDVLEKNLDNKEKQLDSLNALKLFTPSQYLFLKNVMLYKKNINFSKYELENAELRNDSLLLVQSYRLFLSIASFKHFKIKSSKNYVAHLAFFDSINNSAIFSPKIKNYLLYNNIKDIIRNYNQSEILAYFDKFSASVEDTLLVNRISEDFFLDFSNLKSEVENVHLINKFKERGTLKEIIKEYQEKVVYVDFWASWCAPCIKAIPDSKKLIEKYEGKGIVFLFISIDEVFIDWQRASEKINLDFYKHSQLAINYPEATFFKNLNLETIPRYIIYDKKGELVHKKAPGPSDPELEKVLNDFLND